MEFTITAKPQGFVPKWFLNSYPSNGNKEQSGDMRNIDPTDPSTITQGRGMVALTAGTQAAAVTTLIKGMTRNAVTSNVAYGVGGAKLYKFSATAVTNAGDFPHTIDKATVTGEDGEDVCHYKGALYYSYNHSGSAGDIGKFDLNATFDDDWGCYSEDTEVFTLKGWKKIKDVEVGEKVYSINPQTKEVEITTNNETINKSYNGDMISFQNEGVDLLTTPDHKIFAGFRKMDKGKISTDWKIVRADSLLNKSEIKLKKNAIWNGKIIDTWTIPEYDNGSINIIKRDSLGRIKSCSGRRYYKPSRTFPIKPFLRLLGFYISEGSSNEKCINISQMTYSKGWQPIKDTLDELGLSYGYYGQSFDIHDKQVTQYIRSIIPNGFYNKKIPREIMELHPSLLKELFTALMLGDGSGEWQYTTSSPFLRDDFIELVNRLGWSAHFIRTHQKGDKCFHGIATADGYQITINKLKNETTLNHHKSFGGKIVKENYNGNIVCLALEKNHIMLVRRNGKSVWCGNSTVPTGFAALQSAPHQMILGGDDCMYIANGIYIAKYDGTIFTADALDFFDDSQVASITWNQNRVIIAVNRPNLSGSNSNQSAVYHWTGYDDSWEGNPIEVNGRIGALYTKNGVTYIWYESFIKGTTYSTFGYLSGGSVIPLKMFTGSLPLYYQVCEMGDFIVWLSGQRVYAYGPLVEGTVELWQYTSATYATGGGMALPFGLLMTASNATTNYNLAVESGLTIDSYYYTKMFPVSTGKQISQLDQITIWTEQISTGGKLDCTLRYDGGKSNVALDQIAYSASNPTRHIIGKRNLPQVEDFRLEFSWANGSTTNPVRIKSFMIEGHFIDRK